MRQVFDESTLLSMILIFISFISFMDQQFYVGMWARFPLIGLYYSDHWYDHYYLSSEPLLGSAGCKGDKSSKLRIICQLDRGKAGIDSSVLLNIAEGRCLIWQQTQKQLNSINSLDNWGNLIVWYYLQLDIQTNDYTHVYE